MKCKRNRITDSVTKMSFYILNITFNTQKAFVVGYLFKFVKNVMAILDTEV